MDLSAPNDDLKLQKPLEHFRAKTKRLKIHPLELLLLWLVALHLVFLPWAIGGMYLWGQLISVTFAIVTFSIALIPRHYTEDHTGSNSFRLVMWPKSTTCSSKITTSAGRSPGTTKPEAMGASAKAWEDRTICGHQGRSGESVQFNLK